MMPAINKRDYFIRAMQEQCYRYKGWVIEAFATVANLSSKGKDFPFALTRHEDGSYSFFDPVTQTETLLEGTFMEHGPFHFLEEIVIGAHEIANVKQNTITFYGNLLVNCTCLVYSFGDKVPFQTGPMSVSGMEKLIEKRLVDTYHQDDEHVAAEVRNLYVSEFKKFNEAVRHLEGFTQLCVPSASKKTMTVSPEVIKRRNELLKEHEHDIDDPVVQAHIDRELIQMERDWMRGDPGDRFYIKAKSYEIVRKRLFLMQGQENGFGKTGAVIKTSLSEGWDAENLPAMANALRNGSYSRGAMTALGGVEAKGNYRIFQNTIVAEDDCGAKLGLRFTLDPAMAPNFLSSSIIEADGTVVELTDANLSQYVGKPIVLRTVGYCKTPDQNVCAVCVGKKIASTPNAISTYASDLGSVFVSLMLSLMHGTALKTSRIDYITMLR
jgi:hypothetical protein